MASVRKRILKSGEIRWMFDYKDMGGKRHEKMFPTKRDAEAYATKARSEVVQGTHTPDSTAKTVGEAGDLWVQRAVSDGLEASTIKQYKEHLRLHIKPLIGAVKLSRLYTPAVEAFKDDLLKTRSRALSRAVLTSLKGIIKDARRRGLIATNPTEGVKIDVRRSEILDPEDDVDDAMPTKDHIRAILKAATALPFTRVQTTRTGESKVVASPWRALVVTATLTGMRASELRGLVWKNVDLKAGIIRVRQRADRYGVIGPVKSEAGRRDISLTPMVLSTLREWKLACPPTELDLVFPSESGAVLWHTNILRQGVAPIYKAAELVDKEGTPLYGFHSLRHAAASLFIDAGFGRSKRLTTVMGHSSIQVTFDIYGHLLDTDEDGAAAMAALESNLLG